MPILDLSKSRIDKTLGYEYVYAPKHPMANKSGKVYVHRYKAALLGLDITDKHVHHRDDVKNNNIPDNLIVLSSAEHAREHYANLIPYIDSLRHERVIRNCRSCSKEFDSLITSKQLFCSKRCFYDSRLKLYTFTCCICNNIFTSKVDNRVACSRKCGNIYAASFRKIIKD